VDIRVAELLPDGYRVVERMLEDVTHTPLLLVQRVVGRTACVDVGGCRVRREEGEHGPGSLRLLVSSQNGKRSRLIWLPGDGWSDIDPIVLAAWHEHVRVANDARQPIEKLTVGIERAGKIEITLKATAVAEEGLHLVKRLARGQLAR